MSILLTGATGFVGGAVLQRLMQEFNCPIRTYGRREPHGQSKHHVIGDIGENTDYSVGLSGVDTIIHCAGMAHITRNTVDDRCEFNRVNCTGTLNLARQAAAVGVKRFIFISSIGVNGGHNQQGAFRYDDIASPWDAYTQSKYAAELALQQLANETDIEVVIIRPPLIYGANAPGNFGRLIQAVNKGWLLPLGLIANRRSFVALDNLIDLIITCIDHPKAANQIFLVSDDHDVSTTELLKMMARTAGKPSRLLPVPMSWLRLLGKLTGKQAVIERLCGNLQVDISHTKETLGWQPPISVEEGIKRCFVEDKK